MKLLCRKHFGKLAPIDEAGEEALRGIGQDEIITVEFKRSRNIKMLRLYFGLISLVWENSDHERYPTLEDLHGAIKVSVGLRTPVYMPDGTTVFIPGSISFAKMGQDEFKAFYNRVCDVVAKYFLPGVTSEILKTEVEEMIGIAA